MNVALERENKAALGNTVVDPSRHVQIHVTFGRVARQVLLVEQPLDAAAHERQLRLEAEAGEVPRVVAKQGGKTLIFEGHGPEPS